jgi:HK97 family phage major capsid protein
LRDSVNSTGGFLAPEDFDAAIISVREQVGAFRQGAEVRPTRSDGQVRPRRVNGLTANFRGGVHAQHLYHNRHHGPLAT